MEMSLDDIIKQNRSSKRGAGPRRGGSSGGIRRGGSRGGGSSRGSSPRKPGGGVMRGRSRGGIARRRSSSFGRSRPTSNLKREAFLGPSSGSSTRKFGSESTKLIVSNLDYGVTDSDILELFGEFGPLKSAGVHYDRSGRSLGSADLIFERRADAIKAMKQYNGVPLDGREMNIQLATSEIPGNNPIRRMDSRTGGGSSSSFRPRGGSIGRGRGGARGGGRGRGAPTRRGGAAAGGSRQPKKVPTAEELDAELEEYVKSKVSSSEGA